MAFCPVARAKRRAPGVRGQAPGRHDGMLNGRGHRDAGQGASARPRTLVGMDPWAGGETARGRAPAARWHRDAAKRRLRRNAGRLQPSRGPGARVPRSDAKARSRPVRDPALGRQAGRDGVRARRGERRNTPRPHAHGRWTGANYPIAPRESFGRDFTRSVLAVDMVLVLVEQNADTSETMGSTTITAA
jgi:hypothetical protein